EEAAEQTMVEEPQRFGLGSEMLFGAIAYALYRWLKDFFDHQRSLREAELLLQQGEVIAALVREGFPPQQAQAVVVSLLKGIAKRSADDPALKTALKLLGMDKKS